MNVSPFTEHVFHTMERTGGCCGGGVIKRKGARWTGRLDNGSDGKKLRCWFCAQTSEALHLISFSVEAPL